MKASNSLSFMCLIILSIIMLSAHESDAQPIPPSLFISPSSQNFSLWSSPTAIKINVSTSSSINYLYGYQYNILYNQTIFNINQSGIVEGPHLKTGGVQTLCITPNISVSGIIKNIACTRTGPTNVSGSGNLTTLIFNVNLSIRPTTTKIGIVNSKLSNINSQTITHTIYNNGTININECFNWENKSCRNNTGICRTGNYTCVNNLWNLTCIGGVGPSPEICNGLDDDCDGMTDENATGQPLSRSCSIAHNGTCAVGTETCTAGAWAGCPSPQQEICLNGIDEDCDGSDSTCKGDVNGDHCIDITDLSIVALDFGKTSGFTDPRSDIDTNGVVDIFDLVYVGKDFGVGC